MAKNVNKRLGSNIRTLRVHRGMTQSTVASAMGYTRSHICKMESGCCTISAEQILKLSLLFNLPAQLFFLGLGSQLPPDDYTEHNDNKLEQLSERDLRLICGLIDHMLSDRTIE